MSVINTLQLYILYGIMYPVVCIDIIYHVNEEDSPHTYIGDIAADSNISHSLIHQQHAVITFTQLQRMVSSGSQLFNVTNSGKLYTTQTLDAESLCTYNKECSRIVKVAVRKARAFIKIMKIKIIIKDINDHQPEFPDDQIKIEFYETDVKGSTKSIPNAVDKDIGLLNSNITYKLKDKSKKFSLSIFKGFDGINLLKITLEGMLDREEIHSYMLHLVAKDGGTPPKESILKIYISVTDVNDNQPMFTQKSYNTTITDTHHISSPVILLSATDLDSGQNGNITYYLHRNTNKYARKHFKLNSKTGEIFINDNFFRNKENKYQLYIEARDGGNPSLSSMAMLIITVINNQNNVPSINIDFVSPLTKTSTAVSEASKIGSFIAYVMVTDTDSGPNGQIKCNIHHKMFQLSNMGSKEYKILVKEPLDRETIDHYVVSIVCHDMGSPPLKTKKQFSVKVTDVNDVEPHFTKETFQFLTYENQKVDFPIGFINATDPDLGDGGQLTYSIINDNNNDNIPFQLTKYGFISTSQPIDREVKDIYNLQVLVKDNGTPSLNNTANILIEILDKNDNAPYFIFPNNDPYNLDVHYHPHSKKDITILKASDKDTGNNAFLTYGILRSNDKNLFTVNSHTGVLSFSRTVYQNDAGTYELQFIVKDGGTSVQSATTAIILTLFVSNDTSPMLTAIHSQSDNNLNMTWIIIIVAAAVILSVAVVVSITMCVFKCINHINNSSAEKNNPKFLSQTEMRQILYQTNNPVAITRNAEDIFSRNLQSINPKSPYYPEIDQLSGEWKFSTTHRRLPSIPQVSGGSCDQIDNTSIVTSNNLSDTLPSQRDCKHGWNEADVKHQTSEYSNYTPNIPPIPKGEHEQDTYLEPVYKHKYRITYRIRYCHCQTTTAAVTQEHYKRTNACYKNHKRLNNFEGMLDRELKDTYMLQLIARDGGSPPKEGILDIEISVIDVNDNRPTFTQKLYNTTISDTHHISSPVFVLSATDLDSGQNGNINYFLHRNTNEYDKKYFKLNHKSGEIFINDNFFRNKESKYQLYVGARDGGNPSLSSMSTLIINVINNQNNVPSINIDFVSPLTKTSTAISEASKIGSFIAYVMVTDTDRGPNGQIKCNIHHKMFQLSNMGSKEYKILVKEPLDRETIDHYVVSIVCHDMGSPPLKTKKQFSVKVTDVNDVEPHFTKETFQFLTYENQKVDFPIGFINATDPDLGDGGQLTYSIINDNNNDNIPFQLTKYGFISTSQPIDREVKDIYNLQVLVKDNGTPSLNNTANILIEILDKNDNAPYFTLPNNDPYNLDVHYHPHSKKDITILKASDKDTGNNAFLTYGILRSNDKNLFTVNSHTGVLSFSRTVYQNDAGTYELQFIVKDGGTPVQSATTAIILTLFVSNDTSPMLTAIHSQSDNNLDMTWIIIIVAAAVILSVAVVVSITMCVFKCINHFNNSSGEKDNPKFLSRTEMRQILYQTNNPVAITRNAEEIFSRNLQSINPKSPYYPEMEQSANEWKFSTTPRRLPPVPQIYNKQISDESCEQGDNGSIVTSNNLSDTLPSQRDRCRGWSEGDIKNHISEYSNYTPNIPPILKDEHEQDTYLEPIYKK
ncbi:cadherincadherin-23-like [Octopus vulgaris]|uniref:Cadherincadherin-23-like n=1 Tax=Octopus vulgaris TaxID=6645 RepID=A0AA36BG77_OCTVU|nr:cadherincadherin-23-like [Octopus vulgaris]